MKRRQEPCHQAAGPATTVTVAATATGQTEGKSDNPASAFEAGFFFAEVKTPGFSEKARGQQPPKPWILPCKPEFLKYETKKTPGFEEKAGGYRCMLRNFSAS